MDRKSPPGRAQRRAPLGTRTKCSPTPSQSLYRGLCAELGIRHTDGLLYQSLACDGVAADLDAYESIDFACLTQLLEKLTNIHRLRLSLGESECPGNLSRLQRRLKQELKIENAKVQSNLLHSIHDFLKRNPDLLEFEMIGIPFLPKYSALFPEIVPRFSSLKSLTLSRCVFTSESMISIFRKLEKVTTLVQLCLSECRLNDSAGEALVCLLHRRNSGVLDNTWLQSLRDSHDIPLNEGIQILEAYNNTLVSDASLVGVCFRNNRISQKCVPDILSFCEKSTILFFDVTGNFIGPKHCEAIEAIVAPRRVHSRFNSLDPITREAFIRWEVKFTDCPLPCSMVAPTWHFPLTSSIQKSARPSDVPKIAWIYKQKNQYLKAKAMGYKDTILKLRSELENLYDNLIEMENSKSVQISDLKREVESFRQLACPEPVKVVRKTALPPKRSQKRSASATRASGQLQDSPFHPCTRGQESYPSASLSLFRTDRWRSAFFTNSLSHPKKAGIKRSQSASCRVPASQNWLASCTGAMPSAKQSMPYNTFTASPGFPSFTEDRSVAKRRGKPFAPSALSSGLNKSAHSKRPSIGRRAGSSSDVDFTPPRPSYYADSFVKEKLQMNKRKSPSFGGSGSKGPVRALRDASARPLNYIPAPEEISGNEFLRDSSNLENEYPSVSSKDGFSKLPLARQYQFSTNASPTDTASSGPAAEAASLVNIPGSSNSPSISSSAPSPALLNALLQLPKSASKAVHSKPSKARRPHKVSKPPQSAERKKIPSAPIRSTPKKSHPKTSPPAHVPSSVPRRSPSNPNTPSPDSSLFQRSPPMPPSSYPVADLSDEEEGPEQLEEEDGEEYGEGEEESGCLDTEVAVYSDNDAESDDERLYKNGGYGAADANDLGDLEVADELNDADLEEYKRMDPTEGDDDTDDYYA